MHWESETYFFQIIDNIKQTRIEMLILETSCLYNRFTITYAYVFIAFRTESSIRSEQKALLRVSSNGADYQS